MPNTPNTFLFPDEFDDDDVDDGPLTTRELSTVHKRNRKDDFEEDSDDSEKTARKKRRKDKDPKGKGKT